MNDQIIFIKPKTMNTQTKSTLEQERLKRKNDKLTTLLTAAMKELSVVAMTPGSKVDPTLLPQIKKALFANNPQARPTN